MKKQLKLLAFAGAASTLALGFVMNPFVSAVVPGVNEIVSVSSGGTLGNQGAHSSQSVSGDGRFIAFTSTASNMVSGDTNGAWDVFVRDRTSSTTVRVSVSSSGTQGNSDSVNPRISYDGRYVVFDSYANNLITGDTNGMYDIFRHDTQTGVTVLVSESAAGVKANSHSQWPDVSADGRFVVFQSIATNLVAGAPSSIWQVYIKDMSNGAIKALSASTGGTFGNANSSLPRISCDGGVVTFSSDATNLVASDTNGNTDVFVRVLGWGGDGLTNATISGNNTSVDPDISCNGNVIVFGSGATNHVAGDTNGYGDIFAYNRLTQATTRVSLTSSGGQATDHSERPAVSDDGRFVVFQSDGGNLDNAYAAAYSGASMFIRDVKNGTTQGVSLTTSPTGYHSGGSQVPDISADGSYVTYQSNSNHLLAADTNGFADVYISETGF